MSNIALKVEGLSKQYRIGKQERYRTFRDTITDAVTAPVRRVAGLLRGNAAAAANLTETIWALKDINFEVKHGEVVGIIGRNGAGKSTLLKILSRITEPTTGYADVYGRVGALLEVGTGFHPELTGRENVFLNGAILGMSREDIKRKFDEIVDFAGVEKFIDTPVKHYSSGMGLRLGFAVAAHLEPEILIVDEVLAVGDAEFQKKCMGKMSDVAGEGRTVLFVSHNMAAVRQICQTGIVISKGFIQQSGEVNHIVDSYLVSLNSNDTNRIDTPSFIIEDVSIISVSHLTIQTHSTVEIRVKFATKTEIGDPGLYAAILTPDGHRLAAIDFKDLRTVSSLKKGQTAELGFRINNFQFLPGSYLLEVWLKDLFHYKFEQVAARFPFEVVDTPIFGGRKIDQWYGNVHVDAQALDFLNDRH